MHIKLYIYMYITSHFKESFLFVNPLLIVNYDKRMFGVSIRIKYPIIQYFLCISHCIATVWLVTVNLRYGRWPADDLPLCEPRIPS